jgi:hypothetical protein
VATPHISAVAALMPENNPNLTQAQVEELMKATALKVPDAGERTVYDFIMLRATMRPACTPKHGTPLVVIKPVIHWELICFRPRQRCWALR